MQRVGQSHNQSIEEVKAIIIVWTRTGHPPVSLTLAFPSLCCQCFVMSPSVCRSLFAMETSWYISSRTPHLPHTFLQTAGSDANLRFAHAVCVSRTPCTGHRALGRWCREGGQCVVSCSLKPVKNTSNRHRYIHDITDLYRNPDVTG